jgi:hypothetical protein
MLLQQHIILKPDVNYTRSIKLISNRNTETQSSLDPDPADVWTWSHKQEGQPQAWGIIS